MVLDSELPHLIGIDDDLLSTGIILYHLKVVPSGRTGIGPQGVQVAQEMCVLCLRRDRRTWAGRTHPANRTSVSLLRLMKTTGGSGSGSGLTFCSAPAVLHGLDLESEHCVFENQNGTVTLVPLGGAQCSVNGVLVAAPVQLNQGEDPKEPEYFQSISLPGVTRKVLVSSGHC